MVVEIGYRKSLRLIHDGLNNHTDLHPKALSFFSDVMSVFNDKIALLLREQCRESSRRSIDVTVAEATLQRIFPSGLFAKAVEEEGRRAVSDFNNGDLVYVDKTEQKDAKAKEEELRKAGPFLDGVASMLKNMEPIKFENRFRMHLSELLLYVSARLIRAIAEKYARERMPVIGVEEIFFAVNNEFGPQLAEHANAEGMRHVFLYGNKYLCVPPPSKDLFAVRKRKALPQLIHTGIQQLFETLGADVEPKTNEEILMLLGDYARELAKQIRSKSRGDRVMTFQEVEEATRFTLPPVMADHAIAEAYKAIALAQLKHR